MPASDDVTFTVVVTNTDFTPIDLTGLVDNVFGDLDGQGTCSLAQTIAAGASYECSFTGNLNVVGEHTNTVTATASDEQLNQAIREDSATVTVLAPPFIADPNPSKLPQLGGILLLQPATPETAPRTPSGQVGAIAPPSTGGAGLLR